MSRLRALARLVRVGLLLFACLPLHMIALARRRPSPWPRRFLRHAARAMGVDLAIAGRPLGDHALIVANHRSWLDIPVIAAAGGCAFVAKAEIRRWPLVGWLAGLHRTVFVERARRGDAGAQADALRDALGQGQAIALFPEGTTNWRPGLLPFKPSLFASVCPAPAGVRVQPAFIDYGAATDAVNWPDAEGMVANLLRVLGRRGRMAVTVRFLDPIDPAAFVDRKALAAAAQRALESAAISR